MSSSHFPYCPGRLFITTATTGRSSLLFLILLLSGAVYAQDDGGLELAEAVEHTLAHNYALWRQKAAVAIQKGEWQAASGAFDPRLNLSISAGRDNTLYTRRQRPSTGASSAAQGVSSYRLEIKKQFPSGIVISPGIELSRSRALTLDRAPIIRTGASVEALIPLLHGRGSNTAGAQQEAAYLMLVSARFDLHHTTARLLTASASAYWAYRAAYKRLDILRTTEARARTLLEQTTELVEKGQRPASDIDQLRANLAAKSTVRINAEQRLLEARHRLGLAMGLSLDAIASLPAPTDSFPAITAVPSMPYNLQPFIEQAMAHRTDLQSARRQLTAAEVILEAARSNTNPRLDLHLEIGYSGLSEGGAALAEYIPPLGQNDVNGAAAFATIAYSLPVGNRTARGALLQRKAAYRRQRYRVDELAHEIRSGVTVAVEMISSGAAELARANEAVALYRRAVANEKKKLKLGMSTLFAVINIEEHLTNAMLGRVSAQLRCAQAIGRLRLAAGLLLDGKKRNAAVIAHRLIRAPKMFEELMR